MSCPNKISSKKVTGVEKKAKMGGDNHEGKQLEEMTARSEQMKREKKEQPSAKVCANKLKMRKKRIKSESKEKEARKDR